MDLHFLYGGAEIGGVLDGLEVIDHAPDDLEPVGDALERLDKLPPRGLDALLELLELALLRAKQQPPSEARDPSIQSQTDEKESQVGMAYESREQLADAGADVAGLDAVEGREVEVGDEEGVVGGGGHSGGGEGGAGGGRGPRPGAEGAEWGGGREAGEEEEAGRVCEAGGDGEWEACGGEQGGGKEKHGGGGDEDVLTWAPPVGHHFAWASQPQPRWIDGPPREAKQNILRS